jgi:hypothetical protein
MIEQGQYVRDRVSGFEGTVVGITTWLNGCRTVGIRPKVKEDGKMPEVAWIDEPQVESIDDQDRSFVAGSNDTGGENHPTPELRITPSRRM